MVYIAPDGSTQKNRSKWGLSIIFDMFCSLIGFLRLFFSSIVYPPAECLTTRQSTSAQRNKHSLVAGAKTNIRRVKTMGTIQCTPSGG